MSARSIAPLLAVVAVLVNVKVAASADSDELLYSRDVRPIFRAHCFDCHGATDDFKGGLDLRLVRFMQKGGESGPAIVIGKPGKSYLVDRIRSGEMPPGENSVPEAEIKIIERWIAQGAKTARPEPENIPSGLGITPEERSFWSFQPIRRPEVGELTNFSLAARIRSPIDALIRASFPDGTEFSPDADRRTLIRRAYFDLTGLPPAPEEMDRWLNENSTEDDDWYDRLLTELLDSPHYGERWARHWLDVAGYADSEGYTNSDSPRAWAWKYRDWVIRAINEDKPVDQFITEQLAGDELAGPRDGDLTEEQIGLLTATGFLRMAADGTGSGANNAEGRNQVMTDTLKIVGSSLLGLSIQCAQCHDHRYDPIPQTDYYSLRAIFEPALDWKAWKVPNARRVSLYTNADRAKAAEIETEASKIEEERNKKRDEYLAQALDKELEKYDEPLKTQLREAYKTPGGKRTDEQKTILAQNPSVNINAGNLYQYIPKSREELKKFDTRITEVRAKKPAEEFLRALVEPANHIPETKLFHRGDHQQPKQTLSPGALTLAAPEGERRMFDLNNKELTSSGRRLHFARWLTSSRHPLVARVFVNRVWMHHFGKGLVQTPSDFGKLGTAPTHPELLDWLADEFVRQGWSLKKLHRLIMTSTVWRQSSEVNDETSQTPYARKALVRLEAEVIRDRMLAASGQLDRKIFGTPVAIKEDESGQVIVNGQQTRRSLYVQVRRSRPVAMLQTFDAPVMETNCESRPTSTAATQSLMLMNGEFTLQQAARLADRVAKDTEPLNSEQLARLPALPNPPAREWHYGYGRFDESSSRTATFTPFPHWNGSTWQAGEKLPDAKIGWAFLNKNGGHPDIPDRSPIRRWVAPVAGTIAVSGSLSHGSPNGDGVRGRVVSSRFGKAGEWTAFNGSTEAKVDAIEVQPGDTIDFITDCISNYTSDSFSWPVTITLKVAGAVDRKISSTENFRGPTDSREAIAGMIVRAWRLSLCRPPSDDELKLAMEFVARQIATLQSDPSRLPKGRTPERQAVTSVCQSLLSCSEFLYVD